MTLNQAKLIRAGCGEERQAQSVKLGYLLVNAPKRNKNRKIRVARKPARQLSTNSLLPALLAVGGATGIIANPAAALELGELQIDSTLGKPLRASIAYALNPHEELYDFCISLTKAPANGLQTLTRARVSIRDNRIFLRGSKSINEPMLAMRLTVNCPNTAHLARDYVVMVSPPGTTATFAAAKLPVAQKSIPLQTPARQMPARQTPQPTTATASETAQDATAASLATDTAPVQTDASPIQIGSDYRVQSGDSLSTIVSRISDRQLGLWAGVDALFRANPDAFVDGDRNQLKAGSLLSIQLTQESDVTASVDSTVVLANEDTAYAVENNESLATALPNYDDDTAILGSGVDQDIVDSTVELSPADKVANARPGDVFVGNEIQDTAVANRPASTPIVSTTRTVGSTDESAWSWLIWLGGSGLALILWLLLFGRKIRDHFGDNHLQLPTDIDDNEELTQQAPVLEGIDLNLNATGSGNHPMELDADLGIGSGLQSGVDMDAVEDFGFSETGESELSQFDLEITAEAAEEPASQATAIIPLNRIPDQSILDSETPTSGTEEFSQYDLSMIVDATQQADGTLAGTTMDLQAVQVAADEPTESSNTLNEDADFTILEQDYEDELSATQALNKEFTKAALELSDSLDENDAPDVTVEMPSASDNDTLDDLTSELPLADDANLTAELTAELSTDTSAVNDDFISNMDDTGVNTELTAEMPQDDDLTVNFEIESGTVDTKKAS